MRLISPRLHALPVAVGLLAAATLFTTGCNTRPERSPAILEKFSSIDQSLEEVVRMKTALENLRGDVDFALRRLDDPTFVPGTAGMSEQLAALSAKVAEVAKLQAEVAALRAELAALNNGPRPAGTAAAAPAASRPAATTAPASRPAPSAAQQRPAATSTSTGSSAAPASQPAPSVAQQRPATPSTARRGFYYTVRAGDTLAAIARQHNTSVQALVQANRLPGPVDPRPGQQIWVQ
jgi:LysM repeat protein